MKTSRIVIVATWAALVLAPASDALEVGQRAPNCQLTAIGGSPAIELATLRGQVVYLDFWASWCAPCLKSFPFLNELDHDYRPRGLRILAVNVDELRSDADHFLASHPTSFALAKDTNGACPRAFGVHGMPTSYVIDADGIVRLVHGGFRDSDRSMLRSRIAGLVDETTKHQASDRHNEGTRDE